MNKNHNLSISTDIIKDENNLILPVKIELYKNVFGEEPRNEGYECKNPECPKIYYSLSEVTKNNIKKCLCCEDQNDLHECYPDEDLKKERNNRSEKKGYIENLARLKDGTNKLIGFILGWDSNMNNLNSDKFDLNEEDFETLNKNIGSLYGDFNSDDFFYFSEIGIDVNYRHTDDHTARKLYDSMEQGAIKNGKKFIVLRTTKKEGGPYKRFKYKLGYDIVFDYNDINNRIIMVKKIDGENI